MTLPAHNQRILTGLIILIMVGGAAALGRLGIGLLIGLASMVAQYEFYDMVYSNEKKHWLEKGLGLALGLGALVTCGLNVPYAAQAFTIATAMSSALVLLYRFNDGDNRPHLFSALLLIMGFIYVPLVLQMAFRLLPMEILLILVGVVASDTAAYYAGVTMGKRKIWPRVSPKKSWAGSIAGLITCTLAVTIMGSLLFNHNPAFWLLAGMTINVAAQLGDFFESALKRIYEIKDSSQLLPGHGGVLDRIDSLLFALPAYMLLHYLFNLGGNAGLQAGL